jgi:hypothetical protein
VHLQLAAFQNRAYTVGLVAAAVLVEMVVQAVAAADITVAMQSRGTEIKLTTMPLAADPMLA